MYVLLSWTSSNRALHLILNPPFRSSCLYLLQRHDAIRPAFRMDSLVLDLLVLQLQLHLSSTHHVLFPLQLKIFLQDLGNSAMDRMEATNDCGSDKKMHPIGH